MYVFVYEFCASDEQMKAEVDEMFTIVIFASSKALAAHDILMTGVDVSHLFYISEFSLPRNGTG